MNSTTQVPTNASEYRVWVNQVSPNLKDFSFYKAKKGDKVSVINSFSNLRLQCEFVKYEIVELGTGFVKSFGPKNFKKAKQVICNVIYTNSYGIKVKMKMSYEGEAESIVVI